MADPRFCGTEIRRRQGAESNHLAMAEHPNQGDPIAKTIAQKARAKAEGRIAPRPAGLETSEDRAAARKERWESESHTSTPFDNGWVQGVPI
jgi:hypothetical protein